MLIKKYKMFLESKADMSTIIPKSVKVLHDLFKSNGKKLYVVGGAVRDFLKGENPKDFDLCTDSTPDEVLSILNNKYRTNLQGKSFGVVVVYTVDQPKGMEIATFRDESYRNSDIDEFILYIRENKPIDYEKRINLLLNLSNNQST
jgi:tRNA nucleotidyltransferase/poly(A) polymerase